MPAGSGGPAALARLALAQQRLGLVADADQLLDRPLDVALLLAQKLELALELVERHAQLLHLAALRLVEVEQLADLDQREAHALAQQHELQARPVAPAVQPVQPLAP